MISRRIAAIYGCSIDGAVSAITVSVGRRRLFRVDLSAVGSVSEQPCRQVRTVLLTGGRLFFSRLAAVLSADGEGTV